MVNIHGKLNNNQKINYTKGGVIMAPKNHPAMVKIIVRVRDTVFRLFESGEKTKEELHEYTRDELRKECIGFPRVSENYVRMVERFAREKSSQIIPNGTGPYEDLFEFFDLKVTE